MNKKMIQFILTTSRWSSFLIKLIWATMKFYKRWQKEWRKIISVLINLGYPHSSPYYFPSYQMDPTVTCYIKDLKKWKRGEEFVGWVLKRLSKIDCLNSQQNIQTRVQWWTKPLPYHPTQVGTKNLISTLHPTKHNVRNHKIISTLPE